MSLLEKMNKAIEETDTASMEEILHDDFEFYFHSNGKSIGKSELIEWMKSGDVKNEQPLEFYLRIMKWVLITQS